MARRLQSAPAALTLGLDDACRIRRHLQPATGSAAPLHDQLRASPRRSPRPDRPNQPPESTSRWIEVGGNVTEPTLGQNIDLGVGFLAQQKAIMLDALSLRR